VLAVARFGDVTRADFRARFDGVVVVRAIDAFDRFRAARLVATFRVLPGAARDARRDLRGGRLRGTARSGQKGSTNRSHGTVRLGT
jgi:hypothetical protein